MKISKNYIYMFFVIAFFTVLAINVYYANIGYNAYEARERTGIITWAVGIVIYIILQLYYNRIIRK